MADDARIDLPQNKEGICFTCGYMGAYLPGQGDIPAAGSMLLFEATWSLRESGELWRAGASAELSTMPQCARLVREPIEELAELLSQGRRKAAATRDVLKKNRECEKWCQYTPHFSPKEHLVEARMLEIEKMRREQAELIADVQRQVMVEQTKIAAEHAKTAQLQGDILSRMEAHERESSRETTKFNRWFVALAVVAAILALGQIVVPDGLPLISYRPGQDIHIVLEEPTRSPSPVAEALTPPPSLGPTPPRASPQPQ
jgi:hypothetical protein